MGRAPKEGRGGPIHGLGSTTAQEELRLAFYDLDFSIHKSRRYHESLSRFYAGWRDRFRIVTAVAGSGAFVLVVSDVSWLAEGFTGFVALWAVLDIIASPDKKSDIHFDLSKRFTVLAAELETAARSEHALIALKAKRLEIETLEPPCKRLVDLAARNDECRAREFDPDDLVPISTWQRRFGWYFDFGIERLERWKVERRQQKAPEALRAE